MRDDSADILALLDLAVRRGILSAEAAREWLDRRETVGIQPSTAGQLLEGGLLTQDQIDDLRAALAEKRDKQAPSDRPHAVSWAWQVEGERDGKRSVGAPHSPPVIPGYELLDVIGSGGMGVVYRARQETPRRTVAVKILRTVLATEVTRRRFEREAQAAADLSHPGVVTIHEFGEAGGQPFFTMELVEGLRLDRYVRDRALSLRDTLSLMRDICEAIAYAHQRGVIHRDLKPANIVVTEGAQPKILDFGLAKLSEAMDRETLVSLTIEGEVLGTAAYMAPEQTQGKSEAIDVRTDVYALGVILYELVTDRLPHEPEEDSVFRLMERIREVPPERPSLVNKLVGDEVETIVLKALAKEKERRYPSADALAADIQRYLAGEPIEAKRASTLYHLRKLAYRHRAILLPALAASFLAIAVFVLAFFKVRAERNAALEAKAAAEAAKEAESTQRRAAQKAEGLAEQERDRALRELYFSALPLAAVKAANLEFDEALKLLGKCPVQYRNWEWGYVKSLCRTDMMTLRGHTRAVGSVDYSPDGGYLAAGDGDGVIKIWDAHSGRELLSVKKYAKGTGNKLAYSPDGKRLVTVGGEGMIKILDAATGEDIQVWQGPSSAVVCSATLSPDGKRLAVGDWGNAVRVWDSATESLLLTLTGHSNFVSSVAFSPDGRYLASAGSYDGTIRIWDTQTGDEALRLESFSGAAWEVAFSPDGKLLAGGCEDGIRIWDAATGRELFLREGHTGSVGPVAFSPDGSHLATGGDDHVIRLWDVTTGDEIFVLRGHSHWISSLAFSPDGKRLASGSTDWTVKIWDVMRRSNTVLILEGHEVVDPTPKGRTRWVNWLVFSPDGKHLASTGSDNAVRIWDVATGKQVGTLLGHTETPVSVAYSPDGSFLASGSADKTIRLWDPGSGHEIRTLLGHTDRVTCVTFSPDSRRIASSSANRDRTIRIWDVETGNELLAISGHEHMVESICFSADGKYLASGCKDRTARIWDAHTGTEVSSFVGYTEDIAPVAFWPDGRHLATFSGRMLTIWDVANGHRLLHRELQPHFIGPIAFSPDGRRMVSGAGYHPKVKVWDTTDWRELLSLGGHTQNVRSVAFSPDGRRIASGSLDGTIRIWRAADWTEAATAQAARTTSRPLPR